MTIAGGRDRRGGIALSIAWRAVNMVQPVHAREGREAAPRAEGGRRAELPLAAWERSDALVGA